MKGSVFVLLAIVACVSGLFIDTEPVYPSLPGANGERSSSRVAIFLQTDLIANNSEIATVYLNLATTLSVENAVTIVHDEALPEASQFVSKATMNGITFDQIPPLSHLFDQVAEYLKVSYAAYQYLLTKKYDAVHFPDYEGRGYITALAKKEGLAFENMEIIIGLQMPYIWSKTSNFERLKDNSALSIDYMQRKSVELADVVISPSEFMLRWANRNHWDLSDTTAYVQPNLLSREIISMKNPGNVDVTQVSELVFYGDLIPRDGLILFCDAIDTVRKNVEAPVKVTFLGREADVQGIDSRTYINLRARRWEGIDTSIVSFGADHDAYTTYLVNKKLAREEFLTVISPEQANTPLRIQELIEAGVPFIASDVGGIYEQMKTDVLLFEPRKDKLAAKMSECLTSGFVVYTAKELAPISAEDNINAWLDFHQRKVEPSPEVQFTAPLVSICITHHDRPQLLKQALESIKAQDYDNLEVILVDDNSQTSGALQYLQEIKLDFDMRGWKLIALPENVYLGKARNIAAKEARGEFLLFMDDDNYAATNEVSTFVTAFMHMPKTDILTTAQYFFSGSATPDESSVYKIGIPLGGDAATGFFWNCFGDANAMVRKSAFEKLEGFSEDFGLGYEDYEFFAKAVVNGHRLDMVPEMLFYYRRSFDSMSFSTDLFKNRMRYLRAYTTGVSPDVKNFFLYSQSMHYDAERPTIMGYNATCENITTCGECRPEYNCGWCYGQNKCFSGTNKTMSFHGTCKAEEGWIYNQTCFDCANATDCDSCHKQNKGCGWCYGSNKCLAGGNKQSDFAGVCKNTDGWWFDLKCAACPSYTKKGCYKCANVYGCGWCRKSETCENGAHIGPFDGKVSKCAAGKSHDNSSWYYDKKYCPTKKDKSIAIIVGVSVAGVLVVLAIAAVAIYFFVQYRKKSREQMYMAINQG